MPDGPGRTTSRASWPRGRDGACGRSSSGCPAAASSDEGSVAYIAVRRERGAPFADADVERLEALADHASVALADGRLLSDLRREEAQRRSLAASIVLAQESERRRVAEDIHDGPVQELVGVGLMLDALATELRDGSPAVVADVNRAAAAAREAVRALRRAISDLHPMSLEELGFHRRGAIGGGADRVARRPRRSRSRRRRPALGDAPHARVPHRAGGGRQHRAPRRPAGRGDHGDRARRPGRRWWCATTGAASTPAAGRPGVAEGHLGLAAAEERASLGGGRLVVDSAPGAGTTLTLTLPAEREDADQSAESLSSADESASASAKRSSTTT